MLPNTDKCYGCAACAAVCPQDAISLSKDKEGFMYPIINNELCINCKLCETHCPSLNHNVLTNNDTVPQAYSARRKDEKLLKLSSSGGVASDIAEWFASNGGYICGVVYDSDYCGAHYECTNDITVISKMRGSKYIQAKTGNVYKDALRLLENKKNILFIGTACQVSAFKLFIPAIYYNNVFTIEIICHGPTSQSVLERFIKSKEKQHKSKVIEFSVRDKELGWRPMQLKIKYESGEYERTPFYSTELGTAFKILQRPCCYTCKYKQINHEADLMIGDFWGLDKTDKRYDSFGVSSVVAFTPKGKDLFCGLKDIVVGNATYEEIISGNPAIVMPTKKRLYRGLYFAVYQKLGLRMADRIIYKPFYTLEKIEKKILKK